MFLACVRAWSLRMSQPMVLFCRWTPVYVSQPGILKDEEDDLELAVMSIGFMLPNEDDAVIWRGPRKNGLIKQFLTDVEWGSLDFLIIDTPPGTSDEHISLVQLLQGALGPHDGAVVVSTPQEVSLLDARKELSFCQKTQLRVLGVVENMAELQIPLTSDAFRLCDQHGDDVTESALMMIRQHCPELLNFSIACEVFPTAKGGAEAMANAFGCPFLGRVPLEPSLTRACEQGASYTAATRLAGGASVLQPIVQRLLTLVEFEQNQLATAS